METAMYTLKKLSIHDGRDIYDMLQEIPADENGFLNSMAGKPFSEWQAWLDKSVKSAEQDGVIDGWKVPQTTFWLYENDVPVGYGKIRHFLTDRLLEAGGNVGYAIRPSARGRGLGKILLKLLVSEGEKLGVKEFLLTVHEDNEPSVRVALACGGAVEKRAGERCYIWIKPGQCGE